MPDPFHGQEFKVYPIRTDPPPMNIYSYSDKDFVAPALRAKRRQVKNACTNCQRACKKCDDARPCLRCVKYGVSEECVDSQRKERKKGVKRGPYKKRDGRAVATETPVVSSVANPHQLTQYLPAMAYPPYYPQYAAQDKPPDGPPPMLYAAPPYYLATFSQQDLEQQQQQQQQQQQMAVYQAASSLYQAPYYYMPSRQATQPQYPLYTQQQKQPPHEMLPNASH